MNATTVGHEELVGYPGMTIFHLRNWLMDLEEEPRVAVFHPKVRELLDFVEQEDPHPFGVYADYQWDEFYESCLELASRLDHFVRKSYSPSVFRLPRLPRSIATASLFNSFNREW